MKFLGTIKQLKEIALKGLTGGSSITIKADDAQATDQVLTSHCSCHPDAYG
jgi:hypothetical protein